MKSNQRKIGVTLSYVSIFVNVLIQLLYTPLLISKLGQSEYGLYSLVSSIIGYLTVLDLGFGNAIVVYTARYHEQKQYEKERRLHGMFHLIYLVIGCVAGLIGVLLSLNTANIFGGSMNDGEIQKMKIMTLILSFNLFVTFAFNIYTSIITASEKFIFQKVLAIINTVARPLMMIPLLFLGFKSIALCIVITVINIAVLMANYFYCTRSIKIKVKFLGFDKTLLWTVLGYSLWVFLSQVVDKVNWSADQAILGIVSGTVAVSVYAAASQLNTLFLNLSIAISNVFLPKMSKLVAKKTPSWQLTEEFIKVGRLQYYVIFLAASGLVIYGKEFIGLWLGKGFEEVYRVALILIIPLCLPLIQNLGISIMQAMNRFKFKAISTTIMAVFNIAISVLLAQKYGATGAAIGTAVALIICNVIIINIYYYKVIKLNVLRFWKEIAILSLKFVIPIALVMPINTLVELSGWSGFVIKASVYTVFFAANAYIWCLNSYERQLVNKVMSRIIKKRR